MDLDAAYQRVHGQLDAEDYVGALTALAELTDVGAALANDPRDTDFLYLRVIALLGLKRYAEALPLSVQLLTSSSTDEGKWLALCSSLRALGFIELALQVNAHALKHISAPDYELTRFAGDSLFRTHRYEEALDAYQPALTQFAEYVQSWPIWYNYATCLTETGNAKDAPEANRRALRALQRWLATGSVTSEGALATLWRYEGILLARLGRWSTAEQTLTRALRADPSSYEAALWLHAACKAQHKRISGALILPWVYGTGLATRRRDAREEQDLLEQRRSVPEATLKQVRALIALQNLL